MKQVMLCYVDVFQSTSLDTLGQRRENYVREPKSYYVAQPQDMSCSCVTMVVVDGKESKEGSHDRHLNETEVKHKTETAWVLFPK